MGPFLADRISGGFGLWLCGVAIATSAVSLATRESQRATTEPPVWRQGACKQRSSSDPRTVLSVGPMLEAGSYRDVMRDTVRSELERTSPWRVELSDAPSGGFFVDGTVDEMKIQYDGETVRVSCELNLWVRSVDRPIRLITGAATVDTTSRGRDIALSRQACVTTVAEELVERLLVGDPWE